MLSIMSLTYQGNSVENQIGSIEERRHHLFTKYVECLSVRELIYDTQS